MWYSNEVLLRYQKARSLESCPSWPKEHDWKSCKRLQPFRGFESLTLRKRRSAVQNSRSTFVGRDISFLRYKTVFFMIFSCLLIKKHEKEQPPMTIYGCRRLCCFEKDQDDECVICHAEGSASCKVSAESAEESVIRILSFCTSRGKPSLSVVSLKCRGSSGR